jgi:outer membrane lipoprotein SlyB
MFSRDFLKSVVSTITLLALLNLSACTTTGTKERVLAEPMNADLEAQVLKETGTSGAVIGAIGGALVGGLATMAAARAAGASAEEALIMGAIGAVAGGTAGGMGGYQHGKKQGEKVVAQAITRDQVAKYLQGAKDYNDRLAQSNAMLKTQLNSARQIEKPNVRKARLAQIDKAARTELKDVDKRLAQREKAVDNLNWGNKSDEATYKKRVTELKAQRTTLVNTINSLNEA